MYEHLFVMFADALLLLYEWADKEDERFHLAAARWHARIVRDGKLPLREAESVMALLCGRAVPIAIWCAAGSCCWWRGLD